MTAYTLILTGSFVLLTGSALLALRWALRTGQFHHTERDALLVFDDEEPLGQVSDRFPQPLTLTRDERKSP